MVSILEDVCRRKKDSFYFFHWNKVFTVVIFRQWTICRLYTELVPKQKIDKKSKLFFFTFEEKRTKPAITHIKGSDTDYSFLSEIGFTTVYKALAIKGGVVFTITPPLYGLVV